MGDGSHGNGKNRRRHRGRGRGRRNPRGRARQSGHESHRARARPASHHPGLQPARRIALLPAAGSAPEPEAPAVTGGGMPMCARPRSRPSYGNQAGGGTVHYGAVSWRLHEDDFRARSQTIERYGASAIPADSSLVDWPLSYAELEPYYDRAEYELGVSGKAGNLQGSKISGGNVFEAPRRREFPLPPLRADQSGVAFDAGAPSSAIIRFRLRVQSCRKRMAAGRAAPIAPSARHSAAMSARSRRSS